MNLRINIHKRQKAECKLSYDHYRNIRKNATFSIQAIKKLPENSYDNGKCHAWVSTSKWRLLNWNTLHCLPTAQLTVELKLWIKIVPTKTLDFPIL